MHTIIESDRQCARDLLAGFAHLNPDADFMLEQCASHIAAHRERETAFMGTLLASEKQAKIDRGDMLCDFTERIQGALGTAESGDALVEVARNAHLAELELAQRISKETLEKSEQRERVLEDAHLHTQHDNH